MSMASISWRRGKQVTVYYTDKSSNKQRPLPRGQTKHLYGKPRDEVHKWVEDRERNNGYAQARADRTVLKEDDLLATLWKQYQLHQSKIKSRRPSTAKAETEIFEGDICAFFY